MSAPHILCTGFWHDDNRGDDDKNDRNDNPVLVKQERIISLEMPDRFQYVASVEIIDWRRRAASRSRLRGRSR